MTNGSLAFSYLVKARSRLKILPVLQNDLNYSDVVRKSQELVKLQSEPTARERRCPRSDHHSRSTPGVVGRRPNADHF
jgi:hypothetical protein